MSSCSVGVQFVVVLICLADVIRGQWMLTFTSVNTGNPRSTLSCQRDTNSVHYNVTKVEFNPVGSTTCTCYFRLLEGTVIRLSNNNNPFISPSWYPQERYFEITNDNGQMSIRFFSGGQQMVFFITDNWYFISDCVAFDVRCGSGTFIEPFNPYDCGKTTIVQPTTRSTTPTRTSTTNQLGTSIKTSTTVNNNQGNNQTTDLNTNPTTSGNSIGPIIGGVIAALLIIIIAIAIALYVYKTRKCPLKSGSNKSSTEMHGCNVRNQPGSGANIRQENPYIVDEGDVSVDVQGTQGIRNSGVPSPYEEINNEGLINMNNQEQDTILPYGSTHQNTAKGEEISPYGVTQINSQNLKEQILPYGTTHQSTAKREEISPYGVTEMNGPKLEQQISPYGVTFQGNAKQEEISPYGVTPANQASPVQYNPDNTSKQEEISPYMYRVTPANQAPPVPHNSGKISNPSNIVDGHAPGNDASPYGVVELNPNMQKPMPKPPPVPPSQYAEISVEKLVPKSQDSPYEISQGLKGDITYIDLKVGKDEVPAGPEQARINAGLSQQGVDTKKENVVVVYAEPTKKKDRIT